MRVPTSGSRKVLAIPVTAIQNIGGKTVVFVQASESEFAPREVKLGAEQQSWVEVLSGLKPGEKVVVEGSFYLKSSLQRERIGGEGH